jgi:hypothetical protein
MLMLEKLIALFERGVAALEKIATVQAAPSAIPPQPAEAPARARKPAAAKPEEKPVEKASDEDFLSDPVKEYTVDEVRAALKDAAARLNDSAKARDILKKHGGVDTLGDLKKERFAAVVEAANKA